MRGKSEVSRDSSNHMSKGTLFSNTGRKGGTLGIPLYSEVGWWLKIENPGHTRVSNQDTFFEV